MNSPLFRFFFKFIFPRWPLVLGVIFAGLGMSAASIPFPIVLRKVIDEVVPQGDWAKLIVYGLVLAGLVTAEGLLSFLAQALKVRGGEAILYDAERTLASHVLKLPHRFFQENTAGYLIGRVRSDPEVAKDFFFGLVDFFQNLVFLLAGLAILLWLEWRLAILALAILPLLAAISKHMNTRMGMLCKDIQEGEANVAKELGEAFSGALHARLLGAHKWLMTRISRALELLRLARVRTNVYGAKAGGALTFVTSLGPVLFLVFGTFLVLRGSVTLGTVIAFLTFLPYLYRPTQSLILTRLNFERSKVAAARVFELLDLPPEPEDGGFLSIAHPTLIVENVSFAYDGTKNVLHDVSFWTRPGEWVALAGAVGSGKSTLLALVVRLFPFEHGRILLDGKDVREIALPELRRRVLLVPQETFLFSGTVLRTSLWERIFRKKKCGESAGL